MITGKVNSRLEPTLDLTLHDSSGNSFAVEAIIDTGFDGALTLPVPLVGKLGLKWRARLGGYLADGSYVDFDVYSTQVVWNGIARWVDVEATGTIVLLGTALLQGHVLHIEFNSGGLVTIDALP